MTKPIGTVTIPALDGLEVDGCFIIGKPRPVAGTNKLRALANVCGMLCVVEISVNFMEGKDAVSVDHQP